MSRQLDRTGFITYSGRTRAGKAWHRRSYDDGVERVVYVVRYRAVKGSARRMSFWVHLPPSYGSPPPVDEPHLHRFLVAHLARRGVELPQVVQLQRNQASGENPGFHSVGLFALSEGSIRVLRSYPGVRGVPHAPPERDYWFKRGSLRGFASEVKQVPANPAALARVGDIAALEEPVVLSGALFSDPKADIMESVPI